MENNLIEEEIISSWIYLTSIIKNCRVTTEFSYNESVILNLAYKKYLFDAKGLLPVKEIIKETFMLKSLVNRTIDALESKKMIIKEKNITDKRELNIKINPNNIDKYIKSHNDILKYVKKIVDFIGIEDAKSFAKISKKLLVYSRGGN